MGRKERRAREQKRENYAEKHSAEKRKQILIAVGVFAVVGAIVAYSVVLFTENSSVAAGGPEGAGPLGSDHTHAAILVKIFGDTFDFSTPAYQIKSSWIHFEGSDGSTIHKHATGVTLGYLFETLALGIDEECFVFTDGRQFCTNDEYELLYFINGEQVDDIRDHETVEGDRILISYGADTPEKLASEQLQIEGQPLIT